MMPAGEAAPGRVPDASSALSFAVAGVLSQGDATPRLSYRGVGEGYDAARMVPGCVVAVGDGVELAFRLPAGSVDFILLEPAAVPGNYRIPRMTWAGETLTDLRLRVMKADTHAEDRAGSGGVRMVSGHNRPAVELDVRDLACGESGVDVGLLLQRDNDGAVAADALAQVADRLAREHALGHAGIARLGRESASASDRIDNVNDAVSGVASAIAAGQLELAARMDALEAAVERCAAEQTLAGLIAFAERSEAERFAARAAAAEAAARDLESIRHALAGLQEQVDRVIHSVENVFWRRWLRRLRGGTR